jgi:hypothetical protein
VGGTDDLLQLGEDLEHLEGRGAHPVVVIADLHAPGVVAEADEREDDARDGRDLVGPNPAEPELSTRSKTLLVVVVVIVFAWILDNDNDNDDRIEISSTVC